MLIEQSITEAEHHPLMQQHFDKHITKTWQKKKRAVIGVPRCGLFCAAAESSLLVFMA